MAEPSQSEASRKAAVRELRLHLKQFPQHVVPPLFLNEGIQVDVPRPHQPFHSRLEHLILKAYPYDQTPDRAIQRDLLTGIYPVLFGTDLREMLSFSNAERRAWNERWNNSEQLSRYAKSNAFSRRLAKLGRWLVQKSRGPRD